MKNKVIIIFFAMTFIFFNSYILAQESSEEVFNNIYEKGLWGKDENNQNFSGDGSTYKNNISYIQFINEFLIINNIQSVVDAGCGDWTFSKYINWQNIQYIGIDVVKSVIEKNNIQFSTPMISFMAADIINCDLPSADLLVCKDVLNHLTNDDIKQFLKQLSKFKYCLITNDIDLLNHYNNTFINRGDHRPIDLSKAPFNIEGEKVFQYFTNVYSRQQLKQVILIKNY